jgi:hypothetical protein
MSNLNGSPGELRFTIEVKRKATGKTETHELIGKIIPDEKEAK